MGYLTTALRSLRENGVGRFDKQENRMPTFGMIGMIESMTRAENSLFSAEQLQAFMGSFGRGTEIAVTDVENMTVTNTRSCAQVPNEGTSELVTLNWGTLSVGFALSPYQFNYNQLAFEQELMRRWKNAQKALGKAYEVIIETMLDTNKSVVYDSSLVGAAADYPLTGDTLQVSTALRSLFFNDAKSILRADDFDTPLYVIGSTELESSVMEYANQGGGNSTNLGFQFMDYLFNYSNRVPVTSGSRSTGYIMPGGTIAHAVRHTPEQLANADAKGGAIKWSTQFAEELGFTVGLTEEDDCADISARSGAAEHTAGKVISFKVDFDYMTAVAYNSDDTTYPGGIKKFDLLS